MVAEVVLLYRFRRSCVTRRSSCEKQESAKHENAAPLLRLPS